jgi:hypothetical protein
MELLQTKKKLYANAQVLLLGGLTWYLIGVIDLPLIKDQIDVIGMF